MGGRGGQRKPRRRAVFKLSLKEWEALACTYNLSIIELNQDDAMWALITPRVFLIWEWVSRVWKEHHGHLGTQQAITREWNSAVLKIHKECMQLPFLKSVSKKSNLITTLGKEKCKVHTHLMNALQCAFNFGKWSQRLPEVTYRVLGSFEWVTPYYLSKS